MVDLQFLQVTSSIIMSHSFLDKGPKGLIHLFRSASLLNDDSLMTNLSDPILDTTMLHLA